MSSFRSPDVGHVASTRGNQWLEFMSRDQPPYHMASQSGSLVVYAVANNITRREAWEKIVTTGRIRCRRGKGRHDIQVVLESLSHVTRRNVGNRIDPAHEICENKAGT